MIYWDRQTREMYRTTQFSKPALWAVFVQFTVVFGRKELAKFHLTFVPRTWAPCNQCFEGFFMFHFLYKQEENNSLNLIVYIFQRSLNLILAIEIILESVILDKTSQYLFVKKNLLILTAEYGPGMDIISGQRGRYTRLASVKNS